MIASGLAIFATVLSFIAKLFGVNIDATAIFKDAIEKLPPPQNADGARKESEKEAEEKWRAAQGKPVDDSANTKS